MRLPSFLRKDTPFEKRFNQHDTGAFMTPDAPALEAKVEHLVFIYDDMMFNRAEYPAIEHLVVEHMGPGLAFVSVEAYISKDTGRVIAMLSDRQERAVWSDHQGSYAAHIRGSLFKVKPKAFLELDSIYANNIYCKRHEIICDLWKRRSNTQLLDKAWTYLAIPERWELDGGYEWRPLNINKHNYFAEEPHYYHSSRSSKLVRQVL